MIKPDVNSSCQSFVGSSPVTINTPTHCITLLKQLFMDSSAHRETESRLTWLIHWTEAYHYDQTNPKTVQTFASRLSFLRKIWNDTTHFRPFDTIISSVTYLKDPAHQNQNYLIRLSTTEPGSVTVTYKKFMCHTSIKHSRFAVSDRGNIVDSFGIEHESIETLVDWFSSCVYSTKGRTYLAGYDQTEKVLISATQFCFTKQ
jgi:hypothetical protein